MQLRFVSWNVLNLIHEKKYNPDSVILSRYENREGQRIDEIVSLIKNNLYKKNTIIALQECFEVLHQRLIVEFSNEFDIFDNKCNDNQDFLIILTPKHLNLTKEAVNFQYEKISYGYLIVSNKTFRILSF